MKKIVLSVIAIFIITITTYAQDVSIKSMMDKYSEKEGFTTVNISSEFLSSLLGIKKKNKESNLLHVKILSVDNEKLNKKINFYNELMPEFNRKNCETLVEIKEKGNDFVILKRENKKRGNEYVLISGGEDNVMIYVEGNLSVEELEEIAKEIK